MPVHTKRPLSAEPRITGLRVDCEAVYAAIDRERRRRNMKFYEVAGLLGVSRSVVTGWGHGGPISTDYLARCLAWLGRPLSDFTVISEPAQPHPGAQDDAA